MSVPAALCTARRPRRRGRWAGVAAALALVLWGHALLLQGVLPPPPGARGAAPAALQVRTLPAAPAAPAEPEAAAGDAAEAVPVPVPTTRPAAVPARRAAARATDAADATQVPAVPALAAAPAPAGGTRPGGEPAPAPPAAEPGGALAAAGEPPPLYPTRLPPPARLRYRLHYHGQDGDALLDWAHDGRRYRLALDGRSAAGAPLVEQLSVGALDAAGLAPGRFVDRRRGRGWQAANVERAASAAAEPPPPGAGSAPVVAGGAPAAVAPAAAAGRVRFSGPLREHPAWPGLQDRLSWVAQFAAVLAAAPVPPPSAWRLFVVDARGEGGWWDFVDQGEATLATPLGPATARHWRRDPPQPEGLRIDAWTDAARGHWPLRLRFTQGRGGEVFELTLADEPAAAVP